VRTWTDDKVAAYAAFVTAALRAENKRLDKRIMEYEADEASVCPEDVGFVEFIGVLQSKLAEMRETLNEIAVTYGEDSPPKMRAMARKALSSTASSSAWLAQHDREVVARALAWIPVSERLPETDGGYNICNSTGCVTFGYFGRDEIWRRGDREVLSPQPTWWQPKPDPPETK
jgi:hypothetical protein